MLKVKVKSTHEYENKKLPSDIMAQLKALDVKTIEFQWQGGCDEGYLQEPTRKYPMSLMKESINGHGLRGCTMEQEMAIAMETTLSTTLRMGL